MSIFSRILAFLNFIAVVVLVYFAAQAYIARLAWQKALRNLETERDGIPTAELLERVRSVYPDRVASLEQQRPLSEAGLRQALVRIVFPEKQPELLADAARTNELMSRFGMSYDDVRNVVEERIDRVRTELAIEERTLLDRRRELERTRRHLEHEIREAEARVKALQQQVQEERANHDKIRAAIRARQLEVLFLQARLGEAYTSLQLTQSRLDDMVAELKDLLERENHLAKICLQLEQEIRLLEQKLQSRSNP